MSECGIYTITHTDSGRVYVGSSIRLTHRLKEHARKLRRGGHENERLQHAFTKYGEAAFVLRVVELVADRADVLGREQAWIDELGAADRERGFNLYPIAGSPALTKHTEASRRRMREAQLRRPPCSAETRAKLSAALTGRPKAPEAVAKQRMKVLGRKATPEQIARQIAATKGRKRNPEAVARGAASHRGMKRSPEARANMAAAQRRRFAREAQERARAS